MSKGARVKGFIKNMNTNVVNEFLFNPSSFSDRTSVVFATINSAGTSSGKLVFVRGDNMTLSLRIYLRTHNYSEMKKFIDFMDTLVPDKTKRFVQSPPVALFAFGKYIKKCVIEEMTRDWTEFNEQLDPIEVSVSLSLKEVI